MPSSVENETNSKSYELLQDWYCVNICRTARTFSLWTLNSFQIMALIVFREFLPLGTGSYTPTSSIYLLLLKPSTCDCESRMSCTRSRLLITRFSLSAWFMTALAWLLKVKRQPEEEESQTFVSFIGVCASLCFRRQSSAGTSRGMLPIMASWGIMNQECHIWSATQNYLLRDPLNGSLSGWERAKGPAKASSIHCWMVFAWQTVKDPSQKKKKEKAKDRRDIAALPRRYSGIKACQSMSWPDASLWAW